MSEESYDYFLNLVTVILILMGACVVLFVGVQVTYFGWNLYLERKVMNQCQTQHSLMECRQLLKGEDSTYRIKN